MLPGCRYTKSADLNIIEGPDEKALFGIDTNREEADKYEDPKVIRSIKNSNKIK